MSNRMTLGDKYYTGKWKVEGDEIREFAQRYDPQPIHLDEEFAKIGLFGQIVASGFMTISIAWALWIRSGVPGTDQRAGISLDKVRWLKPVFIGDELYAVVEVRQLRETSQKGFCVAVLSFSLKNQKEELVLEFETTGLMKV